MPWLGFPAAVDLANTVVVTAAGQVDLLTNDDELSAWAAAERGSVPGVESTSGRLAEVRNLRDHVRGALFAAAEGRRLPPEDAAALNAASAEALSYPELRGTDGAEEVFVSDDRFALFRAAVARSAIAILAGADRARLEVCRAPSCGMLFLRRSAAQRWCCAACGNRSRVARHARRQRMKTPARGANLSPRSISFEPDSPAPG